MPKPNRRLLGRTEYHYIGDDIYDISSPPISVHQYLILGKTAALLIDSGFGVGELKKITEEITCLPVILINTHGHPDHAGGNAEFSDTRMNPDDFDVFDQMASLSFRQEDLKHIPGAERFIPALLPDAKRPAALFDGQRIDLGEREINVIFTPGHTHGSICLYDERTKTLFAGDNLQGHITALREWNSTSVETYYHSLKKLTELKINRICAGHDPSCLPESLLANKVTCAERILAGCDLGIEGEFRGLTTHTVMWEETGIEYVKVFDN